MRLVAKRDSIQIIPENEIDEAYIEEVLGLKQRGDTAVAVRVSPIGLDHTLAFVQILKKF